MGDPPPSSWERIDMVREPRSKYFRLAEFESAHPLAEPVPEYWYGRVQDVMDSLDVLRERWGKALHITGNGGYRCPRHNRAMGGANRSEHLHARAVDLFVQEEDMELFLLIVWGLHDNDAFPFPLSGVGGYPDKNFVHLDFGGRMRVGGTPRRWGMY